MPEPGELRFLGYTDYVYRPRPDGVYADRAFALFLAGVGAEFRSAAIAGRVLDSAEGARYRLPAAVRVVAMPWYESLADPVAVARALRVGVRSFARALEDADAVWLLGPHPTQLPLALLARARGRRVALGVRQDFVAYVRSRHPRRPLIRLAGYALEAAWRALALVVPVVVVGEDLARRYRHARALLPINVSLVRDADMAGPEVAEARRYDGELRALSVGRLEEEKNPLLLADVLAALRARDERWRLTICGEGPLEPALRERLEELGVAPYADLVGYVPLDAGLLDLYRSSHALLHVSWTEGVPQVLHEAFASRLPVVATAVGGVAAAVGDAALLVPPGDAEAPADALTRVAGDAALRARLIEAGAHGAAAHTLEAEAGRVARFLAGGGVMPRFAVIVPAYQAEATLASALDSVRAQTVEDWEAVIVDDGSTDFTPAIADELARNDPRIRVVHRENGGLPAARNTGLAASEAPYVSLLDSDDLWLPDYLETLGALLDTRPDAGWAFGDAWRFRSGTAQVLRQTTMREIGAPESLPATSAEWFAALLRHNFVFGLTTLRRDALEALGGWAEHLRAAEDWHLLLRLTRDGWTGAFAERPLCLYRVHPAQMSSDAGRMVLARETVLREAAHWELSPELASAARAALGRAIEAQTTRAADTAAAPAPAWRRGAKRALGPFADLRGRRFVPPRAVRRAFPDLAAR